MCKLNTILNHLTPKYLSDTLQSYQTQDRYSTRTVANPVQLNTPLLTKNHLEKTFLYLLFNAGMNYLLQLPTPLCHHVSKWG